MGDDDELKEAIAETRGAIGKGVVDELVSFRCASDIFEAEDWVGGSTTGWAVFCTTGITIDAHDPVRSDEGETRDTPRGVLESENGDDWDILRRSAGSVVTNNLKKQTSTSWPSGIVNMNGSIFLLP